MEILTIVINDPPYGSGKPYNALRLASAAMSVKFSVNVFLLDDGVFVAKKGQTTPEGYPNLGNMLLDLIKKGTKVKVCGSCAKVRGLSKEDLIEGAEIGSMLELANWVKESSKVLTF